MIDFFWIRLTHMSFISFCFVVLILVDDIIQFGLCFGLLIEYCCVVCFVITEYGFKII